MSTVTVIIPTMAVSARASSLFRAADAVRQQDASCRITVVVNGQKRDRNVMSRLRQADIEVVSLQEGNLVKALAAGVESVQTEYFSVLDDDDILLPDACRRRLAYMDAHPEADVLVTPGYKQFTDGRTERIPARFNSGDPLASLFESNWLAPCGAIYRRSRVGAEYFADMPRYLEWTFLAYRIIRERSVHFCVEDPVPHFTMFDTAGSESQKLEYVLAMPANISRMRDRSLPRHVRHLLEDKFAGALHSAATRCMTSARMKDAWRFHLRCLGKWHGIQYLPFTRHLMLATLRSVFAKRVRTTGILSDL
jgi:hypothetical protein